MLSQAMVIPTIPASDFGRARQFYEGSLGLTPQREFEHMVLYTTGNGTTLGLYESAGAGTSQATYASFKVGDIVSEMSELRAKGVKFEDYDLPGLKTEDGIATDKGDKAAWFKDTEGNILCLNEMA